MKKTLIITMAAILLVSIGSAAHTFVGELKNEILPVQNPEGKTVGSVKDALVDSSGEIAFIVVSLSTEIGREAKDVVVPLNAFLYDHERRTLVLNMSREQLASIPEFRASDLIDPGYAERLYRFYGQAPFWSRGRHP